MRGGPRSAAERSVRAQGDPAAAAEPGAGPGEQRAAGDRDDGERRGAVVRRGDLRLLRGGRQAVVCLGGGGEAARPDRGIVAGVEGADGRRVPGGAGHAGRGGGEGDGAGRGAGGERVTREAGGGRGVPSGWGEHPTRARPR